MRQYWMISGAMALAASVVLTSKAAEVTQDKSQSGQPMTLSGCLISTPNPDPGGSVGKPPVYTLEVASQPTVPGQGGTTTSGSPTSGTSAVKPTVYTLTASESIGLAKHVNHLIEVTGRLQATKAESGGQPSATPGTKAPQPELKAGGAHNTFEVTALKMVSASCKQPPGR